MEAVKRRFVLIILSIWIGVDNSNAIIPTNVTSSALLKSDFERLLELFVKEKQNLQTWVATQETTLNNKIAMLEQNLNTTISELDKFSLQLNKEKQERQILQQNYDQLVLEFYNISVNYNSLLTEVTKEEAKSIALDAQNVHLQGRYKDLEKYLHNISEMLNDTDFKADHAELLELKQKTGFYSAFTVWYPVNGPTAGTVSFSRIVTNIGGQYFPNTGKFYCSHPGIYYFSMAIYKNYYSQVAYCYMRKNGAGLLYAQSTASSSSDGSHSAIVHLSSGDVVDLGGCSGVSYMSIYSSFSGFLLKAD